MAVEVHEMGQVLESGVRAFRRIPGTEEGDTRVWVPDSPLPSINLQDTAFDGLFHELNVLNPTPKPDSEQADVTPVTQRESVAA